MNAGSDSRSKHFFFILLLGLLAYYPTLHLGFNFDDHVLIEPNPSIRTWNLATLKKEFFSDVTGDVAGKVYYRPLFHVINRMDYTVWHLRPFGYHLTNLAFHLANALLIYELILALGMTAAAALATSLLFVANPIAVSELIMICGRMELSCLFFSLAAILFLLKEPGGGTVGAGCFAYLCALLSKENAIAVPGFLALALYQRKELKKRGGLLLLTCGITALFLLWRSHLLGTASVALPTQLIPLFFLKVFPKIIFHYAGLIVLPWNLYSFRLIPPLSHAWPLYLLALGITGAGCFYSGTRMMGLIFGWILLTLLAKSPAMIIDGQICDHWVYPAAWAILLPLGLAVAREGMSSHKRRRYTVLFFYGALLIFYTYLAHLNVALRGTDEKNYRWALNFRTPDWMELNLGMLLLQTGRAPEAIPYLEHYLALAPREPTADNALALAYWNAGKKKRAVDLLRTVLTLRPKDPVTLHNFQLMKNHPEQTPIPINITVGVKPHAYDR